MPVKRKPRPTCVGIWVFSVLAEDSELVKWGRGGGNELPCLNEQEAVDKATKLLLSNSHCNDKFYIVRVFDNGQIDMNSFDHNDMVRVNEHGIAALRRSN